MDTFARCPCLPLSLLKLCERSDVESNDLVILCLLGELIGRHRLQGIPRTKVVVESLAHLGKPRAPSFRNARQKSLTASSAEDFQSAGVGKGFAEAR